ncbi:MAG: pyridoxamine 5'-phosphate oxidase family protein [Deltaproteobacteria bacterium]|nr:pyridoxamine 5'-phosphate oxidase family protein [Deltaproteobacteria bacterium]
MSSAGSGAVALPAELVDFVESGVSVLVGTRDAALKPEAQRAVGCVVRGDRRVLAVLVPEGTGARTLANLAAGSPVAVTFSRIVDHRTVQVKGACERVREASAAEIEAARRYVSAFTEALYFIGMSRAISRRLGLEPLWVVEVGVGELFEQTPGPGAGARMEPRP